MIQKDMDGYAVRVAYFIPLKQFPKPFTIKPMYVHLTVHSAYSLQEGLATPAEFVRAAHEFGMTALGLTDHRLLTGAIEFVSACRQKGIQPVVGLEIDIASGPLHLLATSLTGWSNLCRLSSALTLQDDPEKPCSLDLLSSYSAGLIALSNELDPLTEIFRDRLYVALRDPNSAPALADHARKLGLPTVVTHPVYYLMPEQATLQRALTAIRLNQPIATLSQQAQSPADAYFIHPQEMERRFRDFPEALAAT